MSSESLTVIVGLGKTGLSCAQFLAAKNQPFAVMDSREEPPEWENFIKTYPRVELIRGQFSEKLLNEAQEIILSPGVSLQEPLIAKQAAQGKSIIGDIELFARNVNKPIIAITGSNGKTTVTTVVGLMMKAAGRNVSVCGNIGEPVLEQITPEPDYYVLELSSFQLETTFSLRSQAATILNISEDHMNRYATLQDYLRAKQRIYTDCFIPIVNADEPEIWCHLPFNKKPLSFGLNNAADFSLAEHNQKTSIAYQGKILMPIQELKLNARHHLQNALAALALGTAAKIPIENMLHLLRDFSGIRHRCQWVRKYKEIDYYNDSKGTNVGATRAAIESLGQAAKGQLILIAGGQGKGADFSPLKDVVKRYVKQVILIGEDAPLLEKTLKEITVIKHADSMNEAVKRSTQAAKAGDIVLLSPACASFDMFTNYEHRGDVFTETVEAL
ncbi:UDP-N-acetylmuramoyl-L-alanine--D-glutamate ligase [Coxiella burnetii]|uniref:UDP-N-acetylmuramoylalanine--D-glutamate ligase n=1 Tax=Coxiella burnetii (strain CbuK_Q154) TaxID=434924 RepID=MURD_COXB1|nr:UDP-N-acetylmuramoyl-L-alanine--D-glutamate ligase [Coxiella burnetii]B6J5K6.1 RecName: Full=UDP-N-acetylmuramoylalanine--D-glutamate ligase; AltName: Full=D-glutamic acid-adding enzyme; AltName: Full=UDP-N-acetylmuramoyl-L-alanyl-D-glutamate synthetase [Coxiella burnetii CbuK_Q154]ACJ21032.1 UDP-N-acetylmuramoylalanine--D-glutamate ligase [Coxiella burnetii CbuK_Q154]AIT64112.1 UDP-N-acetylmuramoylalanine--D-glutamate ligase [Coxiella burnetii str. Namibia]ATN86624.1 UDP-N-acetylmuramoylala